MQINIRSRDTALLLSALALLSELWRSYLDAMFVYPVDFGDPGLMHAAAIIASALFTIWAGALFIAWRGSRRALISAFVINLLVLLAVPLSWLFFYCPADCRAQAGALFNLANTLNLVFGVLAVIGLGLQMLPSSRLTARVSPSELKND